jgi:hypothetical protein
MRGEKAPIDSEYEEKELLCPIIDPKLMLNFNECG